MMMDLVTLVNKSKQIKYKMMMMVMTVLEILIKNLIALQKESRT